jgi:CHAT domain-containing protein
MLVLPRWASDDETSLDFLREVHRRLREGRTPADALQGAQQTLRARPASSAPYYWAGWAIIGR